ncbi:hypothetical protein GGI42DRAFT_300877 [Trichoderma sp. SZMC 28013]
MGGFVEALFWHAEPNFARQSQTTPIHPIHPVSAPPVASLCSVCKFCFPPSTKRCPALQQAWDLEPKAAAAAVVTAVLTCPIQSSGGCSNQTRLDGNSSSSKQHDLAPLPSPHPWPWPVARLPLRYQNCTAPHCTACARYCPYLIPAAPL